MANGRARVVQFAAAIVGTVLVSLLGAWFVFGQEQAAQLVRLEAAETESRRQREIDQATISVLNDAIRGATLRLSELETRIAVNEAKIEQLSAPTQTGR
jgi:hypothetical protein